MPGYVEVVVGHAAVLVAGCGALCSIVLLVATAAWGAGHARLVWAVWREVRLGRTVEEGSVWVTTSPRHEPRVYVVDYVEDRPKRLAVGPRVRAMRLGPWGEADANFAPSAFLTEHRRLSSAEAVEALAAFDGGKSWVPAGRRARKAAGQ